MVIDFMIPTDHIEATLNSVSVQVNFVTPKFNPKTKFISFYAGIAYS